MAEKLKYKIILGRSINKRSKYVTRTRSIRADANEDGQLQLDYVWLVSGPYNELPDSREAQPARHASSGMHTKDLDQNSEFRIKYPTWKNLGQSSVESPSFSNVSGAHGRTNNKDGRADGRHDVKQR